MLGCILQATGCANPAMRSTLQTEQSASSATSPGKFFSDSCREYCIGQGLLRSLRGCCVKSKPVHGTEVCMYFAGPSLRGCPFHGKGEECLPIQSQVLIGVSPHRCAINVNVLVSISSPVKQHWRHPDVPLRWCLPAWTPSLLGILLALEASLVLSCQHTEEPCWLQATGPAPHVAPTTLQGAQSASAAMSPGMHRCACRPYNLPAAQENMQPKRLSCQYFEDVDALCLH